MNTLAGLLIAMPLAFGLLGAFENGSDLTQIADSISATVNVDSGNAFNLGGDRTVGEALDSNLFSYDSAPSFK